MTLRTTSPHPMHSRLLSDSMTGTTLALSLSQFLPMAPQLRSSAGVVPVSGYMVRM